MRARNVLLAVTVVCMLGLVARAEIIRDTSFGNGADTYVGNDSNKGPNSNYGNSVDLDIRHYTGVRAHVGYARIDISGASGSFAGSQLQFFLTSGNGTRTWDVYGVTDETADNWDEMTITYNNTPWMLPATAGNWDIDETKATLLGTISVPSASAVTVTSDTAALDLSSFLASDTNGLVTFIFIGPNNGDGKQYYMATKENTNAAAFAPTLIMPGASLGGALNPQPAEDSIVNRNLLTELTWELISETTALNVYFGTEPNILEMDMLSFASPVTSVNINDFDGFQTPLADGTYYWKIDCYTDPQDPNVLAGPFWSFQATSAPVALSITPAFQAKSAGESASIEALFESAVALDYQWYRSADHANDTPADDIMVGTNSNVLDLTNLTAADEGTYYCVAINGGQTSSDIARLTITRQLAQWDFEGNADDTLGNYNGTLVDEPNVTFPAGMIGQAAQFDGGYVELPDGFADFSAGLTFTVWARPTAAGNWARFLDLGNFDQSDPPVQVDNILFTRNGTSATLRLATGNGTIDAANTLTLNEWQFLAVTVDANRNAVVYKNGLQVATGAVNLPTIVNRTYNYIGQSNWAATGDVLYAGSMDDLRVYNYALDADTLASMYAEVAGPYCRVRPTLDWNGNCVVDITDFATFAADWLECGLWPVSACQ